MGGKILFVDDNEALRSEFRLWFESYGLREASSAAEALEALRRPNEIDLVLLDVQMPGMDGLTALKKIKKLAPEVRVVIMTGYSTKDVVIKALRGGADNYIEKPFDHGQMREIIDRQLAEKAGAGEPGEMDLAAKIEHVKRFIERNCLKKTGLSDAAGAVCLSPKYLSRVFHETTGAGFTEYKLRVRTARAKKLLKETGLSVKQVSIKLGYENAESFIRQFKKLAGTTPSSWRGKSGRRLRSGRSSRQVEKSHK